MTSFGKSEACGQTVLPDMSILIGQKLVENANIKKLKCDIFSNLQTMCLSKNLPKNQVGEIKRIFASPILKK